MTESGCNLTGGPEDAPILFDFYKDAVRRTFCNDLCFDFRIGFDFFDFAVVRSLARNARGLRTR